MIIRFNVLASAIVVIFATVCIWNSSAAQNNHQLPNIPCPKVFQYALSGNKNIGIIVIYNVTYGETTLFVELSQPGFINSTNNGSLSLNFNKHAHKDQVFEYIEAGRIFTFRVDFPDQNVIPIVTSIVVNGIQICSGPKDNSPITSTLSLEFSLRAYKESQSLSISKLYSLITEGIQPSNSKPQSYNHPTWNQLSESEPKSFNYETINRPSYRERQSIHATVNQPTHSVPQSFNYQSFKQQLFNYSTFNRSSHGEPQSFNDPAFNQPSYSEPQSFNYHTFNRQSHGESHSFNHHTFNRLSHSEPQPFNLPILTQSSYIEPEFNESTESEPQPFNYHRFDRPSYREPHLFNHPTFKHPMNREPQSFNYPSLNHPPHGASQSLSYPTFNRPPYRERQSFNHPTFDQPLYSKPHSFNYHTFNRPSNREPHSFNLPTSNHSTYREKKSHPTIDHPTFNHATFEHPTFEHPTSYEPPNSETQSYNHPTFVTPTFDTLNKPPYNGTQTFNQSSYNQSSNSILRSLYNLLFKPSESPSTRAPAATKTIFTDPTTEPTFEIDPIRNTAATSDTPNDNSSVKPSIDRATFEYINSVCGRENVNFNIKKLNVKGTVISKSRFPWIIAVFSKIEGDLKFRCGGSLISTRTVVSAAHCFYLGFEEIRPEQVVISMGRHNLTDTSDARNIDVERIINHPDYNPTLINLDADLAIVRLKESIIFTTSIRPICLWQGPVDARDIEGVSGAIVGWGADDKKNTTTVPTLVNATVVSQITCIRSNDQFNSLTSKRTLCAGNLDGSGPCMGDSGNGLMIKNRNKWMLRGTVSATIGTPTRPCILDQYAIYSDIAMFIEWIRGNMLL